MDRPGVEPGTRPCEGRVFPTILSARNGRRGGIRTRHNRCQRPGSCRWTTLLSKSSICIPAHRVSPRLLLSVVRRRCSGVLVVPERVELSSTACRAVVLPLNQGTRLRQPSVPVHRLGGLSRLQRSVRLEVPAWPGCDLVAGGGGGNRTHVLPLKRRLQRHRLLHPRDGGSTGARTPT